MILDELLEFADAAAVAGSAGTALLGDVIDLETAGLNPGCGEPIYCVMSVDTEVITGGDAGTIQYSLVSDAQAAIAVNGTATVHFNTESIVTDGTDANGEKCKATAIIAAFCLPSGSYERYLGVLVTIGTTAVTAGKVNAFLTKDVAAWKAYADAL